MSVAITAAIAQIVAGLKPGSWTVAFFHDHAVLKVRTSLPESSQPLVDAQGQPLRNEDGTPRTRWGLPDGHDGWDCTVITDEGEVIGQHTSIGQSIETARRSARRKSGQPDGQLEKPEPAADAVSAVPAPRADVPAADPAIEELLNTPVDQIAGEVRVEGDEHA